MTIGVGGGFDLLTALYFDASRVTGVEVNGATLDILRRVYADYFRRLGDRSAGDAGRGRRPPFPRRRARTTATT